MSLHGYSNDDGYEPDDNVTLTSKLDVSNLLHLHPNDSATSTVVSVKLKGTENYQLMKLMHFLMHLDDTYMQIRSFILSRETLPDVRSAYAIIASEESHIVASGSIFGTSQRPSSVTRPNDNRNRRTVGGSTLVCENCGFNGHTIDKCFKIIGYPVDFEMETLISLIKENLINRRGVHANMEGLITNSTNKYLVNVIDVSYLKIKVSHPNGIEAFITKNGNMPLVDYLTLYDVFVVPEYYVSMMSVHKVARDSKLIIAFDEMNCYVLNQDLRGEKVLGTGRQIGGLYYFDGNQDVNHLNFFNINTFDDLPDIPNDEKRRIPIPQRHDTPPPHSGSPFAPLMRMMVGILKVEMHFLHKHWVDAMNAEMDALYRNNTCELAGLLVGRKDIGSKWVFKIKYKSDGEIERHKASEPKDDDPLLENVTDYQKLICKLVYLTTTRRDIVYTVFFLSQFMHNPLKRHLKTALKHTQMQTEQDVVILQEAEYRARASVTSEVVWILKILKDLNCNKLLPVNGVEKGVKENSLNMSKTNPGIGLSTTSDGTRNEVGPVGDTSTVMEGVTPSMIDMNVEKDKLSSVEDTNVLGSFPPLPTPVTTSAGNAPGKSSYAIITGKPSGKKVNVRTLFTPGGNGIDVVVPVDSIRAISERFANTAYGFFLGKKVAYPVVANYVRNTWGKYELIRSMFSSSTGLFSFQFSSMNRLDAMLENGPWFIRNNPLILKKWHLDENLLKEDVSTVPVWVKLYGVPVTAFSEDGLSAIATKLGTPLMLDSYTSDMCMQSWGRSSYARVMVELRADVELKDNIVVAMSKITREGHYTCNVRVEYEWKPPRCSSCKVLGHIHEDCKKNTCAGEKKTVKMPSQTSLGVPNGVVPTIKVSNSNPFDVLNSVDKDGEFGTNGGTTNLVNNEATSSGSSFMNIDNDGEFASNTPIGEKIDKIERQIGEGKLRLLDNDGNPLVPTGIVESDSEVEVVFDETANLRISTSGKDGSDKGYGTNSLLEQWRDSYPDNDDYDPYDDDMYENHDLSEHLQSICDDLDITVRGRKKK
ncbi:cytokinin dehydrogenase 3-like protein [Tanacetum coccineum]